MRNSRFLTLILIGFFGLAISAAANAQEKEPPAAGCVLLETKSFADDEGGAARDFANGFSGPTGASVNGVPYVYRNTVRVERGWKGNRVYVVKIWMCPQVPPPGGGKDAKKDDKKDEKKDPKKNPTPPNVPTFDPRFYELKDGKVVPKSDAPKKTGQAGGAVPIEIVSLSLTSSSPTTTSAQPTQPPARR